MVDRRRLRTDPGIDILTACRDPHLFGSHFRERDGWEPWFTFLRALFALPMTPEQLAIYTKHTGRTTPPPAPVHEAWLNCGRRARKSFMLATTATYLACFKDWTPYLGPGEQGTIMIVAADRKQARVVKRYITGLLKGSPVLAQLIDSETRETITLANRITIEIHTASHRTTRGYSIIAALLDEIAYWPTDETASEPDVEVLNAIKPAMATVPEAILLCASSPHARKGVLWEAHRKHYGRDGDPILVWHGTTRDMNPTVPQRLIDAALEEDPARASAEWLAQFRTDVEGFITREVAAACVSQNVYERAPLRTITYTAFCDPSGGSSDSMTLAIGHFDYASQMVVVDALREAKPPFSPEYVVSEFCQLLKSYRCWQVIGDRYAGEWPREQFSRFGIIYEPAPKPKSELYLDTLALLNSKRIDLLDHAKAFNQLLSLERRSVRGGRDSIDHPPGQHDDCINAIAGLASTLISKSAYNVDALADPNYGADVLPIDEYRRRRLHPTLDDDTYRRVSQPVGRLA
jgi:hypothetical protein